MYITKLLETCYNSDLDKSPSPIKTKQQSTTEKIVTFKPKAKATKKHKTHTLFEPEELTKIIQQTSSLPNPYFSIDLYEIASCIHKYKEYVNKFEYTCLDCGQVLDDDNRFSKSSTNIFEGKRVDSDSRRSIYIQTNERYNLLYKIIEEYNEKNLPNKFLPEFIQQDIIHVYMDIYGSDINRQENLRVLFCILSLFCIRLYNYSCKQNNQELHEYTKLRDQLNDTLDKNLILEYRKVEQYHHLKRKEPIDMTRDELFKLFQISKYNRLFDRLLELQKEPRMYSYCLKKKDVMVIVQKSFRLSDEQFEIFNEWIELYYKNKVWFNIPKLRERCLLSIAHFYHQKHPLFKQYTRKYVSNILEIKQKYIKEYW